MAQFDSNGNATEVNSGCHKPFFPEHWSDMRCFFLVFFFFSIYSFIYLAVVGLSWDLVP